MAQQNENSDDFAGESATPTTSSSNRTDTLTPHHGDEPVPEFMVDDAGDSDDDDEGDDYYTDESDLSNGDRTAVLERDNPYGCRHYRRRCMILAPCCGKFFWCRHCHNDESISADPKKSHEIDRHKVARVKCAVCNLEQDVHDECENPSCRTKFGKYFCSVCRFFDDDTSKNTYHCDQCGICRVGGRENFFHCETCGCCYATSLKDNHKCIQGSMNQNCPVCQENLFHSTKSSRMLRCGHMLHNDCLRGLFAHRYTCPICNKSIADMTEHIQRMDAEVAATEMPAEYRDLMLPILCNDCHEPSEVKFHVVGLKCQHCGSYNTRRI